MEPDKLAFVQTIFPFIALMAVLGIGGWVITTWMRIKNGYPLESSWGKPLHPQKNDEAMERIRLLSQENAQLRAEMGSVKDRLANVERIVTDDAHRLGHEIDALRLTKN